MTVGQRVMTGFTLQREAHGGPQGLAGGAARSQLDHAQQGGHAVGGEGQVLPPRRRRVRHPGEDPQAEVSLAVLQAAQRHRAQGRQEEGTHAQHPG